MAPPVNRKAAERAKLAIFGESAVVHPAGGQGSLKLTADALKMHEFSSDSEGSTPSSSRTPHSDTSSVSSLDEEDMPLRATQLSPVVDDTNTGNDGGEAKLPGMNCSMDSTEVAAAAAAAAAVAAAAAAAAGAPGTAATIATKTGGDPKASSILKKKTIISL